MKPTTYSSNFSLENGVQVRPESRNRINDRHMDSRFKPEYILQAKKEHPLYINLRTLTEKILGGYKIAVKRYLDVHWKSNKRLVTNIIIQYLNFVDQLIVKEILVKELSLKTTVVLVPLFTLKKNFGEDQEDNLFWIFLPTEIPLSGISEYIVFFIRNKIKKGACHSSYASVKSGARLSVFLQLQRNHETPISVLANDCHQTLQEVYNANSSQNHQALQVYFSQNLNQHFNSNICFFVKKEKNSERDIFFPNGLADAASRLFSITLSPTFSAPGNSQFSQLLKMGDNIIENTRETTPGALIPVSKNKKSYKYESWGKNNWMLQNYIDVNFSRQKQAGKIYRHTDGYFYVNLGLKSVIDGSIILMKLDSLNTEQKYRFVEWVTITPMSKLYSTVKKFEPPTPLLEEFSREYLFEFNTEHIFVQNKQRILSVFPGVSEDVVFTWFSQEIFKQIELAKKSPETQLEYHFYNTKKTEGYSIPLMYEDKLRLVAIVEKKQLTTQNVSNYNSFDIFSLRNNICNYNEKIDSQEITYKSEWVYNIVTVLFPVWAYNNTRILGIPRTQWMKDFAFSFDAAGEEGYNLVLHSPEFHLK